MPASVNTLKGHRRESPPENPCNITTALCRRQHMSGCASGIACRCPSMGMRTAQAVKLALQSHGQFSANAAKALGHGIFFGEKCKPKNNSKQPRCQFAVLSAHGACDWQRTHWATHPPQRLGLLAEEPERMGSGAIHLVLSSRSLFSFSVPCEELLNWTRNDAKRFGIACVETHPYFPP